MQKGENLTLNDLMFDPTGLTAIEFGKDTAGKDASRQHFKETGTTEDWHDIPAGDLKTLKEFARINELYQEADKVIE